MTEDLKCLILKAGNYAEQQGFCVIEKFFCGDFVFIRNCMKVKNYCSTMAIIKIQHPSLPS